MMGGKLQSSSGEEPRDAWRLKLMLLMLPPVCPVLLLPAAALWE